jgi:predicted ATPase
MAYKIALMGTSGVGKTTLAKALSLELKIPILEENLTPVVDAIKAINQRGLSHEALEEKTKQLMAELRTWVLSRAKAQLENSGFICDRTAVDILDILLSSSMIFNDEMIVGLLKEIRRQLMKIDLVVILPISEHTFETPHNEDGLKRSVYLQHKLHGQALKIGLLAMFSPKPTLMIEARISSVEDRVRIIKERLLAIQK